MSSALTSEMDVLRSRIADLERQAQQQHTAPGNEGHALSSLVLDSITDGVSVSDENGFILYTNSAEDRMFGYEPRELLGCHVTIQNSYPPEENTRRVREVIEQLKAHGSWQGQWCNRRKDGSDFYTHARITAIEHGGKRCWVCVQEEVGSRRLLEEQFQTLADSIANLAWMAHSDGYIFWYNQRWYDYTGTTPEQMQGWGWQSVHNPDELPAVVEGWKSSIRSGQPFEMVFPLRGADGQFRPFLTRVVPIFDSAGHVDRWFGTNTDVSAQVDAENALRTVEKHLVSVVEASGKLLESRSVSQVLAEIMDLAPKLVLADAAAVWRCNPEGDWSVAASTGLSAEYAAEYANDACRHLHGHLPGEELVAVPDVLVAAGYEERRPFFNREHIRALVGSTLCIRSQLTGMLMFYFRQPRTFSEGEKVVVKALGNVAASVLGSAEVYELEAETRHKAEAGERRAEFVAEAAAILGSSLHVETALANVLRLAVPSFSDFAWAEVTGASGQPAISAAHHVDPSQVAALREALEGGSSAPPAWSLASMLRVPILATGRPLGQITFGMSVAERVFAKGDLGAAQEVARCAGVAFENSRLHFEIRGAEERARLAMEAADLGTWDWDLATDKLTLSPRCKAFFGLPPDAATSQSLLPSLIHPDDRENLAPRARGSTDPDGDGTSHFEFRAVLPDGTERWLVSTGRVVFEGEGPARRAVRLIGIVQDITASRLAEQERQALLAGEKEARRTAELLNRVGPLLLSELDRDRLVQKLVEIGSRLVGAEHGALLQDFEAPEGFRLDDYQAAPMASDRQPFPGTPTRSLLAVPVYAHTGESFGTLVFGHATAAMFRPRHEQLAAGIAAQAAIALDNARLFEEALRVQVALHKVNQSLRAANTDLEQFAFAAAHDLREPLRMVTSYTQLLERRLASQLEPDTRDFMHQVVDGASRMSDLLQDLLSYTNTATQNAPEALVELELVVNNAVLNLRESISESGAEIRIGPLPSVSGRAAHLLLVFQNLIGNAIKYRKPDVAPVVQINARAQDGQWLFAVSDNGIGIEPRYQTQIFGVFKRLHGREIPGTGIGLAICQRAVERAGGRIWVESRPGEGSTFLFTLPDVPGVPERDSQLK